mmetsp:Transcript_43851/g.75990  ORF Transcript_43851/g.75990 Transcript_43851/m.75990 type:complete len:205 (-) Transcript_43851:249-863(-)
MSLITLLHLFRRLRFSIQFSIHLFSFLLFVLLNVRLLTLLCNSLRGLLNLTVVFIIFSYFFLTLICLIFCFLIILFLDLLRLVSKLMLQLRLLVFVMLHLLLFMLLLSLVILNFLDNPVCLYILLPLPLLVLRSVHHIAFACTLQRYFLPKQLPESCFGLIGHRLTRRHRIGLTIVVLLLLLLLPLKLCHTKRHPADVLPQSQT